MTVLPAMAFAAAIVYWLSHYVSRWFSPNVTSLVDLILFVTVLVVTHSVLKNLRGD